MRTRRAFGQAIALATGIWLHPALAAGNADLPGTDLPRTDLHPTIEHRETGVPPGADEAWIILARDAPTDKPGTDRPGTPGPPGGGGNAGNGNGAGGDDGQAADGRGELGLQRVASLDDCERYPLQDGRGGGLTSAADRQTCLGTLALRDVGRDAQRAFAALAEAFADPTPLNKQRAANSLGQINQTLTIALPILVAGYGSAHGGVHKTAARTLEEVSAYAATAIPTLSRLARDGHPGVARAAAVALGDFGPYGTPALQPLADLLEHDDLAIRYHAGNGIRKVHAGTQATAADIRRAMARYQEHDGVREVAFAPAESSALQEAAIRTLATIGPEGRAQLAASPAADPRAIGDLGEISRISTASVPPVVAALNEPWSSPALRRQLAAAELEPAVGWPELLAALADDRPEMRRSTAREIEATSVEVKKVSADLLEIKNDGRADEIIVQSRLSSQLGAIRERAQASVPPLRTALDDADGRTRASAASALGQLGLASTNGALAVDLSAAVRPLAASLSDPDPAVRHRAAQALGFLGPDAAAGVPELEAAWQGGDAGLRYQAARALDAIEPLNPGPSRVEQIEEATAQEVEALLEQVKGAEPAARHQAVVVLPFTGPKAIAGTEDLVAYLPAAAPEVRQDVVTSLRLIGAEGLSEAQTLTRRLDPEQDPSVRVQAAESLGRIGGYANQSRATLAELLVAEDLDLEVRMSAVEALGYAGESVATAVDGLLDAALSVPDGQVVEDALRDIAAAG